MKRSVNRLEDAKAKLTLMVDGLIRAAVGSNFWTYFTFEYRRVRRQL